MGLSWWHIAIVLLVFVLLFGAGRVSSLMGDIAKGMKSFKKTMAEEEDGGEMGRSETKLLESKSAKRAARKGRTKAGIRSA